MKNYQKIFVTIILSLLIFTSFNVKTAKALTLEEQLDAIQIQINLLVQKIRELIALIESQRGSGEQKSILLISPNGRESWESGRTYDIKWSSSGYPSDSKVKITLIDERKEPNSLDYEIRITEADNNGLYTWAIPELLEGREVFGSLYKIAISAGQGNDKKSDISDGYFTVKKPLSPYLNVISPNGGETWATGTIYEIKWDSPGFENYNVDIILKRGAYTHLRIVDRTQNLSHYNWTPPSSLSGSNYKILVEIYDLQETLVASDSSNNFFTVVRAY